MNTSSWDQWQTTRFSVFVRPSRVEVNAQRDLQDMLAKLDDSSAEPQEAVSIKKFTAEKRNQKFLERVILCGVLVLLAVVFCLIYQVNSASDIASYVKMKDYLERLETLNEATQAVIAEHRERLNPPKGNRDELEDSYYHTDKALDNILSSKTLEEWKLVSQLHDWRNEKSVNLIEESEFYLQFITHLKLIVYSESRELDEVVNWKVLYEFHNAMSIGVHMDILLDIFDIDHPNSTGNIVDVVNEDQLTHYGAKFDIFLCEKEKEFVNRSIACTFVNRSIACTFVNRSIACTFNLVKSLENHLHKIFRNQTSTASNDKNLYSKQKLIGIRKEIERRKLDHLGKMKSANNSSLTQSAVTLFLMVLCLAISIASFVVFVLILRKKLQLSTIASDFLQGITARVNTQKTSADQFVNKMVPRVLTRKFYSGSQATMIPYQVSDTTLFLVSIAGFTKFFNMFTATQTIHILTLIMELLDERMEQYNVFPVARMGQYLLVVSDSETEKQVQHACEIANLALDIMTCLSDLEIGRHATSKLQMKLAMHTGPCTGRLVLHNGTVQLRLVGTTLNVLRHLHHAATPNMIQVSETTQKLLASCECYSLHYRGNLKIKGMSKYYKMYWLNGRRVSSAIESESSCSRMGSWIELEARPLYRLDENEGVYEPMNRWAGRRYSQISAESYNPIAGCSSHNEESEGSV